MGKYSCEKCGKQFKQKSHYTEHKNKKIVCINEDFIDKIVKLKVTETLKNTEPKYNNIDKIIGSNYGHNMYEIIDIIDNIFKNEHRDTILKKLESELIVDANDKYSNAEISTPYNLLDIILNKVDGFFIKKPKVLDYSCGKGNIVISVFLKFYDTLIVSIKDPLECCKLIIGNCLYFADINKDNVATTIYVLHSFCKLLTKEDIIYKYNTFIGDSMKLDINKIWGINGFEGIIVNPPFEDKENKNKTQHKLWIDFTKKTFKSWLLKGGLLFQISPSSFSTPSSKILNIFKEKHVRYLFLNQEVYFPKVNTTISWYIVDNTDKNELTSDEDNFNETNNKLTTIINDKYKIIIDEKLLYLPNDFCNESISIHNKVMFITENKFDVLKDYVTAHNVLLKKENSTISKTKTEKHIYPVFHTNKQIWYSSIKQSFSDMKKVMWTRSGYTKPFYDDSNYGVTDLAYYILVEDDDEGNNLAHNLNSKLFKYILKTAKWSGFGNDKVFYALPKLPNKKMNDADIFKLFNLSNEEIDYIN